jgi:GTP-binding protein YchF
MGIQCGIVGLPNVGKSTLFNALTQAGIDAENFPVLHDRTQHRHRARTRTHGKGKIAASVSPERSIPPPWSLWTLRASLRAPPRAKVSGNQFLANIRETDAIAHVVRCFEDPNVIHVANKIDPLADIETINTELALADLESCEKQLTKVVRTAKSGDKEAVALKTLLEDKLLPQLNEALPVRALTLDDNDWARVKTLHLLTTKPTMYIANVAEDGFENNPHLEAVRAHANAENAGVVVICNKLESEIIELDDEEKIDFLAEMGMEEPGLNRVIRAGYDLLNLQTYFTAGPNEVRAWTIRVGSTAPEAAAVIHTDFQKGFIRAEVIGFEDYVAHRGEQGAKDAGRWRLEGKDYVVADGDVIHFRFNV